MAFPREEHTDCSSRSKWSALKTCVLSDVIWTEQVVFMYLGRCACMRVPVTNTDKAKNLTQIKGECMRKFKVRKEEGKMIKSY